MTKKDKKTLLKVKELLNNENSSTTLTREDLENKLMQMPELEDASYTEHLDSKIATLNAEIEVLEESIKGLKKSNKLMRESMEENQFETIKRMNSINTFQCCDGELCLRGTDEMGKDFTCWWDAYDFLDWIDTENLKYIKEQIKKHIDSK